MMKLGLVVSFPVMVEIQEGQFDFAEFHAGLSQCEEGFALIFQQIEARMTDFGGKIDCGPAAIRLAANYAPEPKTEVVRNLRPAVRRKMPLKRKPPRPAE